MQFIFHDVGYLLMMFYMYSLVPITEDQYMVMFELLVRFLDYPSNGERGEVWEMLTHVRTRWSVHTHRNCCVCVCVCGGGGGGGGGWFEGRKQYPSLYKHVMYINFIMFIPHSSHFNRPEHKNSELWTCREPWWREVYHERLKTLNLT